MIDTRQIRLEMSVLRDLSAEFSALMTLAEDAHGHEWIISKMIQRMVKEGSAEIAGTRAFLEGIEKEGITSEAAQVFETEMRPIIADLAEKTEQMQEFLGSLRLTRE